MFDTYSILLLSLFESKESNSELREMMAIIFSGVQFRNQSFRIHGEVVVCIHIQSTYSQYA